MNVATLEALKAAERLERMGIVVRSAELASEAERFRHFGANGNRAMRRARRRSLKGRER